ncbi:MAG: helix-turn-helix transcriptional regulator [Oscillospiraceae bacterium]|nr:helix-turn-helix transcriptional regulator [Oscillospiraceae bacterium]
METTRKLCPGVAMQIVRQEKPEKMAFCLSQGALLLFGIGGKLRFTSSGRSVTLNPGCFFLLSDAVRRGGLFSELPQGHFEGFWLALETDAADAWSRCSLGIFAPSFSAVLERVTRFDPETALSAGIHGEHVFRELYEAAEEAELIFARLKLAELFLLLARGLIQPAEEGYLPRGKERLIRHLRDHIVSDELHYSSLEELAETHGISVSSLQKSFKQVYGMPVYQYLKTYRLEKAATALHNSDRSVTKIALDAGYTNPAKFSEAFRRQFGLPPSDYRRNRQNQNG